LSPNGSFALAIIQKKWSAAFFRFAKQLTQHMSGSVNNLFIIDWNKQPKMIKEIQNTTFPKL